MITGKPREQGTYLIRYLDDKRRVAYQVVYFEKSLAIYKKEIENTTHYLSIDDIEESLKCT